MLDIGGGYGGTLLGYARMASTWRMCLSKMGPCITDSVAFMHIRTISFIGDSLTLEHYNSLAHLLGFVGSMEEVWERGKTGSLTLHFCENNSTTLHFQRSNYLEVCSGCTITNHPRRFCSEQRELVSR